MRLSAGFTALSSLIRPPKAKKKRRWPWQRGKEHKQHHKAAAALKEGSPEVVAAAAVAELEQEEQRRRLEKADSAATALAAGTAVLRPAPSDVESGDDPFAALADGRAGEPRCSVLPQRGRDAASRPPPARVPLYRLPLLVWL